MKKLYGLIAVLLILALVLPFNTGSVNAATQTGMKLPSDKVLKSYVDKYVNETKYDYDNGDSWSYYSLNKEALAELPVKERAKVAATMYNCQQNRFTSTKKKTSKYISALGRSFGTYDFGYLEIAEAPAFFTTFAKYVNTGTWMQLDQVLEEHTQSYLNYCQRQTEFNSNDYYLEKHDQVLDLFTVIDGEIKSGAKKCVLISKETKNVKVGSRYGNHKVSVYMVTKPGTIKYTTVNEKSGKKKTVKTKYTSIEAAIDKELVKSKYSDKLVKNAITVTTANEELAGDIHEKLLAGKEQLLKIDTTYENAKVIIDDLNKLMCVKSGGYTFIGEVTKNASDTCTYVYISKDYANVYKKCAEFFTRLETQYKAKASEKLQYDGYYWSSADTLGRESDAQLSYMINTPFAELSDAAKLYAIKLSGVFECVWEHPTDGSLQMVYSYDHYDMGSNTYAEALQKLIDGKAEGVCQVFASYERLIFESLGFETYVRNNGNINHAWTVVKVTNKAGKEMWVPFDYNIGPATGLSVSEDVRQKYLATEEMRYALYLDGLEGAPNYRNFTLEDFFE